MSLDRRPFNKLTPFPSQSINITKGFWQERQKVNREVSIHLQFTKLEEDYHVDNFRVASGLKEGVHRGEFYYDSDLYKWLEAACVILRKTQDLVLREEVDEITELIINSQTSDGYINTFYSINFIERRFTNLNFMHELYCAGHLIEAALAHKKTTGSDLLLDAAVKFVDLIVETFLINGKKGVPGHEEIELALFKLYKFTNKPQYKEMAEEFINRRGYEAKSKKHIIGQFLNLNSTLKESKRKREEYAKQYQSNFNEISEIEDFYENLTFVENLKFIYSHLTGKMHQINKPVRENTEPVGHAVRAMYLYCGMADLYSETGDPELIDVLEKLWMRMVQGKMYITGGIGSLKGVEGFEKDFKLDINKSYSETCAAIGNMMWNLRMLYISGDCKHADLIEKLMYNAVLVGQSIDGRTYTYDNPLVSNGEPRRSDWFLCPCCPPNIARTIASIEKYIYSQTEKCIWIHQYISSELELEIEGKEVKLTQISNFPWNGQVKIKISLKSNTQMSLNLRVPNWSDVIDISLNGEIYQGELTPGRYFKIFRNWLNDDEITINFKMKPQFIKGDPRIKSTIGRVAIIYGPIIYCLEQKDNPEFDIFSEKVRIDQQLDVIHVPDLLGGINMIQGETLSGKKFKAVPYYSWNNRGRDKMQVWMEATQRDLST